MNVYAKLAQARLMLKQKGLKPTGVNAFSHYNYFELADFIPEITKIEAELGIVSIVSFGCDLAVLKMVNVDTPEELIEFYSPMSTATLKGCHEVQNLGAVETYIRRYLYNIAYEIVESDALDGQGNKQEKAEKPKEEKADKQDDTMQKLRETRLTEIKAIMKEKGLDRDDLKVVQETYGIDKIEFTPPVIYAKFIEALKVYGEA